MNWFKETLKLSSYLGNCGFPLGAKHQIQPLSLYRNSKDITPNTRGKPRRRSFYNQSTPPSLANVGAHIRSSLLLKPYNEVPLLFTFFTYRSIVKNKVSETRHSDIKANPLNRNKCLGCLRLCGDARQGWYTKISTSGHHQPLSRAPILPDSVIGRVLIIWKFIITEGCLMIMS